MKKIRYSEAGQFTDAQRKLCREIATRLEKLRKSGCSVVAKQDRLEVFLSEEIRYSNLVNLGKSWSNEYPIPSLAAGYISDAGADDTECFIDEVIEPEEEEGEKVKLDILS